VQLPTALAEFRKAIENDSTFGIAAVRGAQVATWNHQPNEAASLIRVAVGQELSPRYRLFASGFEAYLDGRADSAAARLRAALVLDPTMTVAWMQLGEVYMHLLPVEGNTDSLAEAALVRARALDSTAATSQFHLVEILARRGDQKGATALAKQFIASAADSQLVREVSLLSACGRTGFSGVDLRAMALQSPLALVVAAKYLGGAAVTTPCAIAAYQMLLRVDTAQTEAADGRRFSAVLGLVEAQLGGEQHDAAVTTIEEFRQRWGYGTTLYLLAAPVVPALAEKARAVAGKDSLEFGPSYAGMKYPVHLWELGVWAAAERRPLLVRAVATDLAARAAPGSRFDSLLASSMAAHATLAEGDSLLALRRFEQLIQMPAPVAQLAWNEAASLGLDRLTLGRLLIWHKEYARAIAVLTVHDSPLPLVYPMYLRASLALRVEAATALKQSSLAATFRARVAALSGG
jgi:hypothetical protein